MTAAELQEALALGTTDGRQALVYQAEAANLTRYATMLVGAEDAGDLVQEAFLRLFQTPSWRAVQIVNEGRYLRQVARSVAAERSRSRRRRQARELKAWFAGQATSNPDPVGDVDDADLLHRVLAELPRQQAEVVRLYALGYRNSEIAQELGIKEGTVRTHRKRSEGAIRRILKADGEGGQ